MADVTYTRPEYDAAQSRWRLVREVCKASRTVKVRCAVYLPRRNKHHTSLENLQRYKSYEQTAVY